MSVVVPPISTTTDVSPFGVRARAPIVLAAGPEKIVSTGNSIDFLIGATLVGFQDIDWSFDISLLKSFYVFFNKHLVSVPGSGGQHGSRDPSWKFSFPEALWPELQFALWIDLPEYFLYHEFVGRISLPEFAYNGSPGEPHFAHPAHCFPNFSCV